MNRPFRCGASRRASFPERRCHDGVPLGRCRFRDECIELGKQYIHASPVFPARRDMASREE
jgi:hypothetical protein